VSPSESGGAPGARGSGAAARLVRVGAHGQAERARQAKVGQLQRVVLPVNEQVLRLQVAVQHPACWLGLGQGRKYKPLGRPAL